MMYIKVKGIDEDGSNYTAIVEGNNVDEVRSELIECMGIEAHCLNVFINELLDMGFDVYTNINGVDLDALPVIEIPINLNNNDDIF